MNLLSKVIQYLFNTYAKFAIKKARDCGIYCYLKEIQVFASNFAAGNKSLPYEK